jgi:hypothetical protein
MTNTTAPSAPVKYDPWDAPYFGAPVYLIYPAFAAPVTVTAPPPAAADVGAPIASAKPEPALVAAASPVAVAPARGWLSRLFGRR